MAKRFAATLSSSQFAEARAFERAGLCSISQAVKAFERGETSRIQEWRRQLAESQKQAEAR